MRLAGLKGVVSEDDERTVSSKTSNDLSKGELDDVDDTASLKVEYLNYNTAMKELRDGLVMFLN